MSIVGKRWRKTGVGQSFSKFRVKMFSNEKGHFVTMTTSGQLESGPCHADLFECDQVVRLEIAKDDQKQFFGKMRNGHTLEGLTSLVLNCSVLKSYSRK